MRVMIDMPEAMWRKVMLALGSHEDCNNGEESWQSEQLEQACAVMAAAIEQTKTTQEQG